MRSTLVVSQKPPYSSTAAKDALDTALASAAFGVNVGLLFMGDGVFQLVKQQNPPPEQKRIAGIFDSLGLYDIEDIYVCEAALGERGLTPEALMIPATIVDNKALKSLLSRYDNLLTF